MPTVRLALASPALLDEGSSIFTLRLKGYMAQFQTAAESETANQTIHLRFFFYLLGPSRVYYWLIKRM